MKKFPNTRQGWIEWYEKRWLATDHPMAFAQANWFQLNLLAFGDRSYSPTRGEAA